MADIVSDTLDLLQVDKSTHARILSILSANLQKYIIEN